MFQKRGAQIMILNTILFPSSRLFTEKVGDCQKILKSRFHDNHP